MFWLIFYIDHILNKDKFHFVSSFFFVPYFPGQLPSVQWCSIVVSTFRVFVYVDIQFAGARFAHRSCTTYRQTKINDWLNFKYLKRKIHLHVQHKPCFPKPTNIVKQRLQYAGLLKCFNFHECVPSSLTFYWR
jgi:hypothetical protein